MLKGLEIAKYHYKNLMLKYNYFIKILNLHNQVFQ